MLNTVASKHKAPITVAFVVCTLTLLISLSSAQVFASSPYASGFDHGCDDADISNPSDRYISQDEKGPSYHTSEFMEGYYEGFDACYSPFNQNSERGSGEFKINVKVTNNFASDESGGIYVRIDDSDVSKTKFGITFPAGETVTRTFEFNSKDVPVGKGFNVEVVYGDDYDEDEDGVNGPESEPEEVHIFIG